MPQNPTKASWTRRNPGRAAVRRWLRVEELEPRILLSASPLPGLLDHAAAFHARPATLSRPKGAPGPRVLQTPGAPGQVVRVEFTATFSSTKFRDEAGLFEVD